MNNNKSIATDVAPKVVIDQIGGDLRLGGWDQNQVTLMQDSEIILQLDGDTIYVQGHGDCTLQVPMIASVTIREVHGDANFNTILGALQIQAIHGDARLHNVGNVVIHQVGGDLTVRQVAEDLQVETVGGDIRLAEVLGNCRVNAGGDLHIDHVHGNLQANGGGDAALRLLLPPATATNINAGGDITCHLPAAANVQINATCGGEIRTKRLTTPMRRTEQVANLTLGTGEAALQLHGGGDIRLLGPKERTTAGEGSGRGFTGENFGADFEFQATDFAQQVVGQVERQMAHLARHLDQRLAHFGNDEEFASRVQEKVQGAMRRAEEKMAEVMRHTEERMRAAEERATHQNEARRQQPQWRPGQPPPPPHAVRPMPPQAPIAPQAPVAPVNDEERRTILRMVSEGKITVEQADQLLTALLNPAAAQTKL